MKKNKQLHKKIMEHMYSNIPAFTDIFTEETFYMFVVTLVISTIMIVFIISRFVKLKPVD